MYVILALAVPIAPALGTLCIRYGIQEAAEQATEQKSRQAQPHG